MSAHNFWNNFSHGFMHGMFDNNPFFGCWGGFPPLWGGCGPVWGRPWMFGGCNPCFNPWRLNSSVFLTPNVMSGNFYQLMPDINPPAFNMSLDMSKLFPTDNIWDSYNKQNIYMQNPFDTFVKTKESNDGVVESSDETRDVNASKESGSKTKGGQSVENDDEPLMSGLKNEKLTDRFTGSAEQLNIMLNKKDGVLKNKGQVFLEAQEKYGINAAILAAICINESGYGTSNLARTKNNVGGVSQGMGFKSYSSVDECIMDMARFLKSGYADKGLVTISQVGKKYCPVGDPRDTKGLNAGWGNAVSSITRQIEALA